MTSFNKPTDSQVNAAVALLCSPNYRAYFFARLTNPNWVIPLRDRGFFDDPQGTEKVEGGGVRHPYWPASQYLARMANIAPSEVADILVRMETDNSSVLTDIVDAANKMPEEIAAKVVPTICKATQSDVFGVIFPKATDLCVRLGSNGQEDAAMTLAEALFGLQHQLGQGTNSERNRYWYKEGIKKVVPVLTEKRPEQFIDSLCKWLGKAITQEKYHTGPGTREDWSWSWRPAIEEHEQNRNYDFACEMVGFVRQAFEQAIGNGHMTLENGLAIVEKQPSSVFTRLRIHLVNHFAERAPELARSIIMMNRSMLEDHECKHEYAMLVGRRFPMLSPPDRDTWLGWVEAGPDMSRFEECFKAGAGREPTETDRLDRICNWQFNRLHWIRNHLDAKWQAFYQQMLSKFGEPLLADLNSYHSCGWGCKSPFTVEELSNLRFEEVLARVDAWQPGQTRTFPDGPQREGLAGTFGQYVASKVEEFAAQAVMLKGRQPIYVRTFIDKMTDAAKAENIDIGAVLRLCTWVVEQPIGQDANDDRASWDMVDRNWRYTRDSICKFLQTICGRGAEEGQEHALVDFREAIIALLERLTHDPAKSYCVDETERKNPEVYDFVDAAINSPRGKAVEALIAYVRWMAKHVQREEAGRMVVRNGFADMPEVKKMLEWQIAVENATFESFAVIGTYIGLLYWIDQSWVEENIPTVFDLVTIERDPMHSHGWAAWNAFLVWGHTSLPLYRALRTQYFYAVERLSQAIVPENAGRAPLDHLGEHLVLLYGRGNLAECSDESLLYQFLEAASNDVRSQTIAFVGHSLRDSKKLPEEIVARFRELWDWYWPKFGPLDAKARPQGGLFGWWFTCKQFSDEWSLERLEQAMQVSPIREFAEQIVERLTELADTYLETVTHILDRMIRADEEGWRAYAWRSSAEKILKLALQGSDNVRGIAVRLIDDLGRRGYLEFGKLLGPSTDGKK
jgi:hypothetical protein